MREELIDEMIGKLKRIFPKISDALVQYLHQSDVMKYTHYLTKGSIARKDHACDKLLYIGRGTLRHYHFQESGEEITSDFDQIGSMVYMPEIEGTGNYIEHIESLGASDILHLDRKALLFLYDTYPETQTLVKIMANENGRLLKQRLTLLCMPTTGQRYAEILLTHGNIIHSIHPNYISSYTCIGKASLYKLMHQHTRKERP
jgi:hypothetical protein